MNLNISDVKWFILYKDTISHRNIENRIYIYTLTHKKTVVYADYSFHKIVITVNMYAGKSCSFNNEPTTVYSDTTLGLSKFVGDTRLS